MKIIDETKRPDIVELIDIEEGECFKIDDDRYSCNGNIFLRTNTNVHVENNAVCLNDGELKYFPSNLDCIPVDTKLTVTHKK